MLESAIGIAMVVYAVHRSIIASKCLIHYFKLVIFKSVFRSVTIFLSLFLRRSEIGDQLVPFPNRKITVWLSFEERMDRSLFVHVINTCRRGN